MATPTLSHAVVADRVGNADSPNDPNVFTFGEIASILADSVAVSSITSGVVSTAASGALNSVPVSTADSKAVSAASRASVADSKAISGSVNTSVADSKALSVSTNVSVADSKAVSAAAFSASPSSVVSTADSKAVSAATKVDSAVPSGRTVTTLSSYVSNNAHFNVKDYGALCDGITDDTAAFNLAVAAAVAGKGKVVVPGWMVVTAPNTISDNDVTIEGTVGGSNGSRIMLSGGLGLIVNTASVNGARFTMRDIEIRLAAALTGYMLDIQASDGIHLDNVRWHNGGGAFATGTTKALRVGEVNNGVIIDPTYIGSGTDAFAVGQDLFQGVTGNRGNLTIIGGLVNRANIGTRIASGASNLVNNVLLLGTKHKATWAAGTIGVDMHSQCKNIELNGVQCEGYETSALADGVSNLAISTCYLSLFDTGYGCRFTNSCSGIFIDNRTRLANNSSAGTGISFDASAHTNVGIDSPSFSNCATNIGNSSTSYSGWRIFSTAGSTSFDGTRAAGFDFGDVVTFEKLVKLNSGGTVAIAAGVLAAPTSSLHTVTTESGASDDLDTITTPGTGLGGTLLLLQAASGKTINVTELGNIVLGAATRVLNSTSDRLLLAWSGSTWVEIAYADNA